MIRVFIRRRLALLVIACAAATTAFAQGAAPDAGVTIFAAASLKNALDDAAAAYKAKSGVASKISYASSLTLAKQIEQGAPADLFASADIESMDYLATRNLIQTSTRVNLLGNRLVVVAPSASPLQSLAFTREAFAAAIGDGRLSTGDIQAVPAGKYAKAALEKLGLWSLVEPRVAGADNVRSALTFVARNEAPLGIVYATDAAAEPGVKIVATFPADSHPAIVYPFAVTKDAKGGGAADMLAYLKSAEAVPFFKKQGFEVLR